VIWVPQEKVDKGEVSLRVEDVMTMGVITIDENASVKEAAEIMNQNEIGCLIAARKGKAIGIITERDLLKRVIVEDKNAKKTKVREVMSSPLEEALRLMLQKKIKKLPVVEKNRLLGLVSLTDIASCQPAIIKMLKAFAVAQNAPRSIKKVLDYYIV
jgi:CBS domain-containing protein